MSVFLIAEAGSNWKVGDDECNFNIVQKMIDAAYNARFDAVKFQFFRPNGLYVPDAGEPDYLGLDINETISKYAMPEGMLEILAEYCQEIGIEFMCTVYEPEDVWIVDKYVKRHKIASYELCHESLLREVMKTKKPIIVSTGAADEKDVRFAVDVLRYEPDVTFLHCTAAYPATAETLNLLAIKRLQGITNTARPFDLPDCRVGLSDHSENSIMAPVMAVALGATVIEKHFTLSRSLPGPDQAFALEPDGLIAMADAVQDAEDMLGDGEKTPKPWEIPLRNFATRSVQAIRNIEPGQPFSIGYNIGVLRPGNRRRGEPARLLNAIDGKAAKISYKKGDGILLSDG